MLTNVADLIRASAQERPTHDALVAGDRSVTYAELDEQVTVLAAGLLATGMGPGDRVCVLMGNRIPFVVALFGILRAGAVAVPLNTTSTSLEIEHAVAACQARILIADAQLTATLDLARLGECEVVVEGAASWTTLVAGDADRARIPAGTDPEAVAVLLFTAGSTGRPKPAMLPHRALLANIEGLRALADPPAAVPEDRALAVLPLFHVYALNAVLTLSLAAGATVELCERFTAPESLDLISRHRITVIAGAPPMYVAWSVEPGLREAFASVRLLTSGAAPLPPALFDQFRTMTGKPIWEGYGLTECSPVVTTTLASGAPKAGSVGAPLPNVEVRVVLGSEEPVPGIGYDEDHGETGEIWVRGASVFAGYWPDGEGGPNDDGWLATGDVGYFDAGGDLHLVNRRADLILVSGFNVYPREVEDVVNALDGVAECAVAGVPHPHTGEAVKAFVAVKPGADVAADEVVAWCEQRLARYKCPTIVEIVAELPHAVTGKIARAQLRES